MFCFQWEQTATFVPVEEKAQKIIEGAAGVFMKYGIKSVNMDDIARNLGISKKTLYKYVSDKNDLLMKALASHSSAEKCAMDAICDKDLNAIDEMLEISNYVSTLLKQIHPSIHFDLEKYHPEVMKNMMEAHEMMIYSCMRNNMEKGIKEGYYREDLNVHVISKIYIEKMDATFNSEIFPPNEIPFSEVYMEYFRYHIRGIASEKGIAYLTKKVKQLSQR